LQQIGELLELKGENPFKYRAYFNAVQIIRSLDVSLKELIDQGRLSSIKGIGKALTKKITELVETGKLEYYENLKQSVPPGLFEIASLPGLDRRKTGLLYLKLGVSTLDELEQACQNDQVCTLRGFSKDDQQQLLVEVKKVRICPTDRKEHGQKKTQFN
jgi:DNA polymerase (family 10)